MDYQPRLEIDSRAEWRDWLVDNHASSGGVWLVTWKPKSGRPTFTYEEQVEEALCFGWVDGQRGPSNPDRIFQWFAPRRPKSTWARSNKERAARLEAVGLMTPAGLAAIERAKANGSWTALDDIDNLVMPPDLDAALLARPGARDAWESYSASSRRMALAWVTQVKSPELRARRVERVADGVARGGKMLEVLGVRG